MSVSTALKMAWKMASLDQCLLATAQGNKCDEFRESERMFLESMSTLKSNLPGFVDTIKIKSAS